MYLSSGEFKNRKIEIPKGSVTRPTSSKVRSAFFNICQQKLEGAYFLDLFAGSGGMGLEALGRGVRQVVFVDQSRQAIECIKKNISLLHVEDRSQVVCAEGIDFLKKIKEKTFDIIYVDPPYSTSIVQDKKSIFLSESVLFQIDQMHQQGMDLLRKEGELFIEESIQVHISADAFPSLLLKSKRTFGDTSLYQWIRNDKK